jgi:hypothetical protein
VRNLTAGEIAEAVALAHLRAARAAGEGLAEFEAEVAGAADDAGRIAAVRRFLERNLDTLAADLERRLGFRLH